VKRRVIFNPETEDDLFRLYEYIAGDSTPERALRYIDRIEKFCFTLRTFPQRGRPLGGALSEIRVVGFERRASIVFRITEEEVVILRILYGGRHLASFFPTGE
jgi:toxin ParE1/3/4